MKTTVESDYRIGETIYIVRCGRIDKIKIDSIQFYENGITYHSAGSIDSVPKGANIFDEKEKAIDYLLTLKRVKLVQELND